MASARWVWVVPWVALFVASSASAQVLHERVQVGGLRCKDHVCYRASVPGGTPTAITTPDGRTVSQPDATAPPQPGEQVFSPQPERPVIVGGSGAGGEPGDKTNERAERRDVIRSDRETGPEPPGTRSYHVIFDPDPFPYKRMTALDQVRITACPGGAANCDDEVLEVFDRTLRALPVLGAGSHQTGRDLFWGSAVVELEPARWVPIPSVASDSRVLEVKLEPPAVVELAEDGAGNQFVRSPLGGQRRLTWLVDAPVSYFGGDIPASVRLSDEPVVMRRVLPDRLRARVQKVLDRIGIHPRPNASLASVLDPLVAWFRAFELGEMPAPSGSSYLDLALAQKGCCRHRSYAFAITAMGLGIPVRYVENEIHVFVEVYIPKRGWRRINLGGAPLDEQLVGGKGKSLYGDRGADPFPTPPAFTAGGGTPPKGLSDLATMDHKVEQSQVAGSKPASGAPSGGSGSGGSGEGSGGSGSGSGSGPGGSGSGPGSGFDGPHPTVNLAELARHDADAVAAEARQPRRVRAILEVTLGTKTSFRGETVELAGTAKVPAGDPTNLPIELYLEVPGGAVLLGRCTTDGTGRFTGSFAVPRDVEPGRYRVIARTPGDTQRLPTSSPH